MSDRGPEFLAESAQIGYPLIKRDTDFASVLSDIQIIFDPETFPSPLPGLADIRFPKLPGACVGACLDGVPYGQSLIAPAINIFKSPTIPFRLRVNYPTGKDIDGSVIFTQILEVRETDALSTTDLEGGFRSYVFNETYSGSDIYINVIVNQNTLDGLTVLNLDGSLDFRTISFLEKNVTEIVFNEDGATVATIGSGATLDLKFGNNTNIEYQGISDPETLGEIVDFSAVAGSGAGQNEPDCESAESNPITSINGIVPDENGNINIQADECYAIGPITASNTLHIDNACQPCLDCDDVVDEYNRLKAINTDVLSLASRFDSVFQEYDNIVTQTNLLIDSLSEARLKVDVLQTADNTYFVYFDFSPGNLASDSSNLSGALPNHTYRVTGFDIQVEADVALPASWDYQLVNRSGRVKIPLFPTSELTNIRVTSELKQPPGYTGSASFTNDIGSQVLSFAVSNITNLTSNIFQYATLPANTFFNSPWESFTRGGGNFTLELTAPAATAWPGGTVTLTFSLTNIQLRGVPNDSVDDPLAVVHTGASFTTAPPSVDVVLDNVTSIP